jgi:hypothetical protein
MENSSRILFGPISIGPGKIENNNIMVPWKDKKGQTEKIISHRKK